MVLSRARGGSLRPRGSASLSTTTRRRVSLPRPRLLVRCPLQTLNPANPLLDAPWETSRGCTLLSFATWSVRTSNCQAQLDGVCLFREKPVLALADQARTLLRLAVLFASQPLMRSIQGALPLQGKAEDTLHISAKVDGKLQMSAEVDDSVPASSTFDIVGIVCSWHQI